MRPRVPKRKAEVGSGRPGTSQDRAREGQDIIEGGFKARPWPMRWLSRAPQLAVHRAASTGATCAWPRQHLWEMQLEPGPERVLIRHDTPPGVGTAAPNELYVDLSGCSASRALVGGDLEMHGPGNRGSRC